jgi:hypothetical protein
MKHSPEGSYDEFIRLTREAQNVLPARCEELAQRFDTLAERIREANVAQKKGEKIQLIIIAIAATAFTALVISAGVSKNPQTEKPTPSLLLR